jgi:hypothetical protein
LSCNDDIGDCADEKRRTSKKKEEEGSSRRRYVDDDDDDDEDMDGRGREGEGGGEGWWDKHRRTQHGQHPHLPPSNDDGGYDDEDLPVIPASDFGEAADHFLAMAVVLLAISSLLLLSSRAAAAAEGPRGNRGFVAVSVGNDDNGVEQKS